MFTSPTVTPFLIGVTILTTFLAWHYPSWQDVLMGYPYKAYHFGEWYRCVTSGFVHADFFHLLVNMYTLYSFGGFVESRYAYAWGSKGVVLYYLLYIGGVVIADVVDVWGNAHNVFYRSLGASAGVSAIVFSYILFAPFSKILFYGIIPVPSWLYGIGYVFVSYYMMGGGRVNHLAHLVGSAYGMAFTLLFHPNLLASYFEVFKRYLGK